MIAVSPDFCPVHKPNIRMFSASPIGAPGFPTAGGQNDRTEKRVHFMIWTARISYAGRCFFAESVSGASRFGTVRPASGAGSLLPGGMQEAFCAHADRVEFVDGISLENEIFVHNFFVPFIGWCKAAEIISAYITI